MPELLCGIYIGGVLRLCAAELRLASNAPYGLNRPNSIVPQNTNAPEAKSRRCAEFWRPATELLTHALASHGPNREVAGIKTKCATASSEPQPRPAARRCSVEKRSHPGRGS